MITSARKQDVSTGSYLNTNQLIFFANKLRNWRRDLHQILNQSSHLTAPHLSLEAITACYLTEGFIRLPLGEFL